MTDQIDRFDKTPSLMPLRRDLLRRLAHAADEAGSPLRLTSFASVSPDGTPQVRTLVLRHFAPETMTLRFYTDARSPKVADLETHPEVQVLMWDPDHKEQIRITGTAELHIGDELADQLWSTVPEYGRGDYLTRLPPGSPLNDPEEHGQDETFGGRNFTVICVKVSCIDWLKLSAQGHRRAQLRWVGDEVAGEWRTP